MLPELAYDALTEYVGYKLKTDNGDYCVLESVQYVGDGNVSYRLEGLNFDIHSDVHSLLRDTSRAYERAR